MGVQTAPCRWPADFTDCADLTQIEGSGDPEMFVEAATEYLWNWTGRRYGLCDVSIRPCRQDCPDLGSTFFSHGSAPWTPVIINGGWYNLECGRCGDLCGCSHVEQLKLPGPVYSVSSITLDGAVLPSGNYRVDNGTWLVRTDGEAWPTCQDMTAAVTEPDTWEITYRRGVAVPVGGQIAAGILATELALAACGSTECRLPSRIQNVSRQGISMTFAMPEDIDKGLTGIWAIDSWVSSIMNSPRPSRVYSPDVQRKSRRQTWP